MELRKLKALLSALRAAGVTEYRSGDLTLVLGAPMLEVPRGDVEGADQDWTAGAPLALTQALDKIRAAYAPKAKTS